MTTKKTADGGIDGRLYFSLPNKPDLESMVIEVKGGKNVNIGDVRGLRGVLDRDEALMVGLIIMEPLGAVKERNFKKEMASTGDPRSAWIAIPAHADADSARDSGRQDVQDSRCSRQGYASANASRDIAARHLASVRPITYNSDVLYLYLLEKVPQVVPHVIRC